MESLQKLRKIGVKKINQDTKLSIGVIENILEKRFEKIQRVWIVGFLAILEREYGVDLSEWLEEYDVYLAQNVPDSADVYKIKELELDTQYQFNASQKGFPISLKQILSIVLGLCGVVVVFFLIKVFSFSDTGGGDYSIVEKPIEQSSESKQQDIYTQLNLPQAQEESKSAELDKIISSNEVQVQEGEVLITPKGELWFQVLNVDTKVKQDRTIREPYLLKLPTQKSVIIFGHKGFELKYKDKAQKFDGGGPIRFIIENNRLKYIRYADYLRLLGIQEVQPEVQPNDEAGDNPQAQKSADSSVDATEGAGSAESASQDASSDANAASAQPEGEAKEVAPKEAMQDAGENPAQEKPKQTDTQENDVEEN